jgi:hypothetical protein
MSVFDEQKGVGVTRVVDRAADEVKGDTKASALLGLTHLDGVNLDL